MTENDKTETDAFNDQSLLRCILKKSGHTTWKLGQYCAIGLLTIGRTGSSEKDGKIS